jgi:single-stranded DNA-binding protein
LQDDFEENNYGESLKKGNNGGVVGHVYMDKRDRAKDKEMAQRMIQKEEMAANRSRACTEGISQVQGD